MLSLAALILAGASMPRLPIASPTVLSPALSEGLRPLADRRRFTLGAATPVRCLQKGFDGGRYAATLDANFNMIELENELKPPAIWKGPREYDFSQTDYVLGAPGKKGWAQQHRMKVRGHVLIYAKDEGYTLPEWFKGPLGDVSKEQAAEMLHGYIRALAGRYRGKIAMWDVVNEAIDDRPNNGNPFNLRNNYWFRKLGPEYLVLAFKWAREADPRAELYYNDYGVEDGGPKGQHMLALGKWLKEKKAPITGLGLQYHIDCRTKIEPNGPYYRYVDDIRKLGLDYMVTELDVTVPAQTFPAGDPNRGMVPADPADLGRQAEVYASVFKMALSTRRCRGINIWGLTDRFSWIPGFSGGRNGAALLFDGDYRPKAAWSAVEAVLKAK
ncbi:hypothetical protein EON79_04025 [bacterium]|nr:MAG: hypothetical protein EON79_04025 [bacterium]